MEDKKNNASLEIELKENVAEGTYVNLTLVAHSPSEFVFDFVSMLPGMNKAQVRSRVIMTPENAKRFMYVLQDNIRKYEMLFGETELKNVDSLLGAKNIKTKGDA